MKLSRLLKRWFDRGAASAVADNDAPGGDVVFASHPVTEKRAVSRYLPSEMWDDLLVLDDNGMPPLRLRRFDDATWLTEDTTGLIVNVGNRRLRPMGIWSVRVRGIRYYDQDVVEGPVSLHREPDNIHDPNAIAIRQNGQLCGYWNKGMAAGLAKQLDAGVELVAVAISPGKVIATTSVILAHLSR